MPRYQLVVSGKGFNVHAFSIDKNKFHFWAGKDSVDFYNYLSEGHDEFSEFSVPREATIEGCFAEKETRLKLLWDSEWQIAKTPPLPENTYGPSINYLGEISLFKLSDEEVQRVDCSNGENLLFLSDQDVKSDIDPDDAEENSVWFKPSEYNLVIVEGEEGEWIYEWESARDDLRISDLKIIQTNHPFGEGIDDYTDGVILGFFHGEHMIDLTDADTITVFGKALLCES